MRYIFWGSVIFIVVALIGHFSPRDSTDRPDGKRSGMGLRIDHLTGCHYLTSATVLGESAITPRLRPNGHQVCTGQEPPK